MMPILCTRAPVMLVLPLLVLPLSGCDIATADFQSQETAEWRQSYEIEPGGQVEIINVNGLIDVRPSAGGNTVEVVAVKRARGGSPEAAREALQLVTIREDVSPRAVKLQTTYPRTSGLFSRGGVEVRYTVSVPASSQVRFTTTNGGIEVRGLSGNVHLRTTNGGIRAEAISGALDASTTNGGVEADVSRVTDAGVRLACTNGGIQLRLPADTRASISASVTNGGIEADGLTLERTESSRRRLEAQLNGGGPPVHLSGTNGGIRISGR